MQHRIELTYADYKKAVYENEEKVVQNTVIRTYNGEMKTMTCNKIGLRDVFIKAAVQDDKITVRPFAKNSKLSF